MATSFEWFHGRNDFSHFSVSGGTIGEYRVEADLAIVFDNGGGGAVIEGSFEDLRLMAGALLEFIEIQESKDDASFDEEVE